MKDRAAVRNARFMRFALLAFLGFACGYCPVASAQSNTTSSRSPVPDDTPDPALVAARSAMDHQDYAEAVRSYQKYLATKPDDADAHFDLGKCVCQFEAKRRGEGRIREGDFSRSRAGCGLYEAWNHVDG